MESLVAARPAPEFTAAPAPVFALLDDAVRDFGPRPVLDFLGRRLTYAELGRQVNAAAAGLQRLGVARGVNVGLCLPNCPYSVIMYFAILKAGGTVVNFNPLYTARELEAQVKLTHLAIMVTLDLALIQEKIGPLAAQNLFRHVIVCSMAAALPPLKALAFRLFKRQELGKTPSGGPYVSFTRLTAGAATPSPVDINPERDIAVLQFTGGTTGTPKAAMLSHANISINVQQIQLAFPSITPGQERGLAVLPFFHVFAMTAVMNFGIREGAELLMLPRLDLKALMRLITTRRPTMLAGVPTLFTAICNAAEAGHIRDFSFLKLCVCGGAPLSAEILDRFEHLTGCAILEGYGLSETSPVVSFNRAGHAKHGSVGPAIPGTSIEIRDPANPEILLPQGERGEICVRGPQVMQGYFEKPEETAAVQTEGALRTGDIGYLDEDGSLFIVDRIKDLIICGGYNVYPRVIEEAAYQHQAVQDAIAIGVFDQYRGQAPKLFVTLRPGATATPAEILTFLTGQLNKIEIPKTVEIRDSLPKTMVGKLSKKELIEEEKAKGK